MDKSGNQLGIQPLARISPVMPVAGINQAAQLLGSGQQAWTQQTSLLNSGLAKSLSGHLRTDVSSAELSPLAKYINQSLQQASTNRLPYVTAQQLVTTTPTQTMQFSQALSQAISRTGLFYESHLADVIDGQRPLSSLKLEPQMQFQQAAYALLPQQLNVLEHHRILWHGEVWPNQLMEWHIHLPEQTSEDQSNLGNRQEAQTVTTELSLDLPELGKVSAQIRLVDGNVHLQLYAAHEETLKHFKDAQLALVKAIEGNGQVLNALHIQAGHMKASHA